ncbi:hypothetical protein RF11_07563 [Thelohanellus kitauei]|uniref:Uncharacterized protein n=1 Tax=Thelohanellus kitauei TaxID=669202 RepID=A0A0C2J9X0_THEKT|nr:hypothetical protein RF11_07563 [Thelohanellus kitauei]
MGIHFIKDKNKLTLEFILKLNTNGDQFHIDRMQVSFQGANDSSKMCFYSEKTNYDQKSANVVVKKIRTQKFLDFKTSPISFNEKKLVIGLDYLILTISDITEDEYDEYYTDFGGSGGRNIMNSECMPAPEGDLTVDIITPGIKRPVPAVVTPPEITHKTIE